MIPFADPTFYEAGTAGNVLLILAGVLGAFGLGVVVLYLLRQGGNRENWQYLLAALAAIGFLLAFTKTVTKVDGHSSEPGNKFDGFGGEERLKGFENRLEDFGAE